MHLRNIWSVKNSCYNDVGLHLGHFRQTQTCSTHLQPIEEPFNHWVLIWLQLFTGGHPVATSFDYLPVCWCPLDVFQSQISPFVADNKSITSVTVVIRDLFSDFHWAQSPLQSYIDFYGVAQSSTGQIQLSVHYLGIAFRVSDGGLIMQCNLQIIS